MYIQGNGVNRENSKFLKGVTPIKQKQVES